MAIQHYQGGCQCGAVRYEVEADTDKTYACNCSRCGRLGTVLAFTPEESFTLRAGEDSLTTYKFNKHVIDHQFCSVCGIQSFSRGKGPARTETREDRRPQLLTAARGRRRGPSISLLQ